MFHPLNDHNLLSVTKVFVNGPLGSSLICSNLVGTILHLLLSQKDCNGSNYYFAFSKKQSKSKLVKIRKCFCQSNIGNWEATQQN